MKYLFLLFFPIALQAQKIKINEIDKFTKKKVIETSDVILKRTMTGAIGCKIRKVDSITTILFQAGNIAIGTIGINDKAILLFQDESTTEIVSPSIQSYDIGDYGNKFIKHMYIVSDSSFSVIKEKKIKSIRFYLNDGYQDVDIPEKNSDNLSKLAKLVSEAK